MKAELRQRPHAVLEGATSIEVWYDGEFIGTVVGADGPGVRILSRRNIEAIGRPSTENPPINILQVLLK